MTQGVTLQRQILNFRKDIISARNLVQQNKGATEPLKSHQTSKPSPRSTGGGSVSV